MVRIPSLSRRSEPAPTRDENLDGRIDGRDTQLADRDDSTVTGGRTSDGDTGRPAVADRDADQTTYRSAAATDDQPGEAERRAAARAAVARAATARPAESGATPARPVETESRSGATGPVETESRSSTARPVETESRSGTARPVETESRSGTAATATRTAERDADLDSTTRRTDTTDRVTTDRPADPTAPEAPVTRGPKPRASLLATLGLIVSVAGALFVLTGTLAGYGIGLGAFGAVLAVLGLMATRRRHVAGKTDALFGVLIGLAAVVIGVLAMTGQFDWPTTDGDWVQRFREWLDSQFVDRF
ncbi:DMT family transporter [Micromonospora sp. WMMD967]|uniref:DMT family transporter n=1 Tax=Micromonospora sp. WMMD967 TaxID=3016101 RepID=UPI00241790F3|nr:DMT family transporter [Micromonospora sp. WMMD967]MDG4841352.1 DMT family transporter [Micromonospora sp. WMMD967]